MKHSHSSVVQSRSIRRVPTNFARARLALGLTLILVVASSMLSGCAEESSPERTVFRTHEQGVLVSDLPRMGGDYPAVLIDGLSRQLIDEVNCIQPGVLVEFQVGQSPGQIYTDRKIPYLIRPEVVAAAEGTAAAHNDFITITSAYRDVGMQYYDYLWGQRLGFLAAQPGSSQHQAGQAIDVKSHEFWRQKLIDYGWDWPYGNDDKPHFEWREVNTPDLKTESVRAFQRLWNRNNPQETIAEDGEWGPTTESKMEKTEAEGFTYGGCDKDTDGFASMEIGGNDCDDTDPSKYPGATEICGDGIDQDCSGADLPCGEDVGPMDMTMDMAQPDMGPADMSVPDMTIADMAMSDFGGMDMGFTDMSTDFGQPQDMPATSDTGVTPTPQSPIAKVWNTAPVEGVTTQSACGCRVTKSTDAPWGALLSGLGLVGFVVLRRRRQR